MGQKITVDDIEVELDEGVDPALLDADPADEEES